MIRKILLCTLAALVLGACQVSKVAPLSDEFAQLALLYGEDAARVAQLYSDDGVSILRNYGDEGAMFMRKYGAKGMRQYGDEGAILLQRYPDDALQILVAKLSIADESSSIADDVAKAWGQMSPTEREEVELLFRAGICYTLERTVSGEGPPTEVDVKVFLTNHVVSRALSWVGAPDWAPDVLSAASKVWQGAKTQTPVNWSIERQKSQLAGACS